MGVFPGLATGASSLSNASQIIKVIGNNIANVNTPGFKRSRATTSEAFYSTLAASNGIQVDKSQVGNGAGQVNIQRIITQGNNKATGITLDVAIEGAGFFILKDITDPAGQRLLYTRDGSFDLDNNRTLIHKATKNTVQAFTVDAAGAITNTLANVVFGTGTSIGRASTKVEFQGNLDSNAENLGTASLFTSDFKTDEFLVITGTNDQIAFESGSSGLITASLITDGLLTSGTAVNGAAVAQAIKTALEAKNGSGDSYTVTYDRPSDRFNIVSNESNVNKITFRHSNTAASTASGLLGFLAVDSEAILQGEKEFSDVGVAFNVIAGVNDTLTATVDGTAVAITVPAGNYTGRELAFKIQQEIITSSPALLGTKVSYSADGSIDRFKLTGPKTGGAHIINQPTNAATPIISVAATQSTVTGGTLLATTGFNTGTGKVGTGFFDAANPVATSSANVSMDVFDDLGGTHSVTVFVRKTGANIWEWHATLDASDLIDPTPGTKRGEFIITAGTNDRLSFEVGGSGLLSADLIGGSGGLVTPGSVVTGATLAAGIRNALEAADPSGDIYAVSYNAVSDKFSITNNLGNLNTITFRHSNTASTASNTLGFLAVDSPAISVGGAEVSDIADAEIEEVASGLLKFTTDGKLDSETLTPGTGLFTFAPEFAGNPAPTANQAITFDFGDAITTDTTVLGTGDDGVSQFSTGSRELSKESEFAIDIIKVDGVRNGLFEALTIDRSDNILATLSNGETQLIARLALALFPAEGELFAVGDNFFIENTASGPPVFVSPDTGGAGRIIPEALETSNSDLGEEFVDLILAQALFQANARVVTVSDEILQALTRI